MKLDLKCGSNGFSIEIKRLPEFESVPYFLKHLNIDLVLDVGANKGVFIDEIQNSGYKGRIIAFEPLPAEFNNLQSKFSSSKRVNVYPYALGNATATARIHFDPKRTELASLQASSENFKNEWGDVNALSADVEVKKLDDIWDGLIGDSKSVFMKIDTQGNDFAVLEGSQAHFDRILGIQSELSLIPLYANQKSVLETIDFLRQHNFCLHSLKPVVFSKNGDILEMDGLFLNISQKNRSKAASA